MNDARLLSTPTPSPAKAKEQDHYGLVPGDKLNQLTVHAGQYTAAGIKPVNEDSCGIRIPPPELRAIRGIACIIADGMSGSEGGREAAEACVQGFLGDYFSTPDSWSAKNAGEKVLGALNRWLYGQSQQRFESGNGMVTTMSALVIKSTTAHLFHVGDTRIYRLRNQQLECLTRDHRAKLGGAKNFLSRAMGIDPHVDIDYRQIAVEEGDRFLLTTDGIHDFLDDGSVARLLQTEAGDLEYCAQVIVEKALGAGSTDNATCQLLEIQRLPTGNEEEFFNRLTQLPFPPPLSAGMILDGYRILREIHASKRTQIYLALDTISDRKVVLKTPSVNYDDDPDYIDQFLYEEWAGKRIDNSHVLKIVDTERRRQCLYYVTEYVPGQTLRQWMHDHPEPSLTEVRTIVEQIAAGLRAFHRMEMLHQDLKPENIMIDEQGTVKIIDFGSTKIAGIQEIDTPLSRNHLLGTQNYTAPEYLQGYAGSKQSDMFSLGIIAYEMLTGHLPYGDDISLRQLARRKYRPSVEHRPGLPVWLDGALEKAVHINPARRYGVLSEFIHDLSHPNPNLINQEYAPLLERNPLGFWRTTAIILLIANLLLVINLLR